MAKWMDLRHTYNLKGKLLLSCLGVVCIALGTTVCRVGNVGVDPFTAMNLGFSARVGMDFGTFQLLVNLAILAAVFALDKYQIGLGTLINMVGVGYLIELFTWLLGFLPKFEGLVSAGVHLAIGTLLFTLGVSLYLKTRMGVAPIDAVAPIAAERLPFSYTACRMTQDISVTVLAVLAGGPIGVFTVIAAFFTGPLITAWNRFATLPLYRRFGILNREELAEATPTAPIAAVSARSRSTKAATRRTSCARTAAGRTQPIWRSADRCCSPLTSWTPAGGWPPTPSSRTAR